MVAIDSRLLAACLAAAAIGAAPVARAVATADAGAPAPVDDDIARVPNVAAFYVADPVFEGDRLYVLTAGPRTTPDDPGQPTLFLVHGLGDAGVRDFYPLLPELAKKRRVVAFDLPGFGRSTRANQHYEPDRYATVLSRMIEQQADGPVDVLGHSMGAAIAIAHEAAHPKQVRRLILVDAAGILHREAFVGHMLRRGTEPTAGLLPDLTKLVKETTAALIGQTEKLDPAPEVILASAMLRKLVLRGDPGRIAAFSLILHNFSPALTTLSAPTLIVWGEDDVVAPLRTGEALAARIRRSELVTLKRVGHVPMKQAPIPLLGLIDRHLSADSIPATSPPSPGKTQGEGRCSGRPGMRFAGVYDRIVLERCDRVVIDGVTAGQLVARESKATVSRSTFRDGIVADASELTMTGGRVGGAVGLDLQDSRLDLAGVSIEATQQTERLKGTSRLLYSVCPVTTRGRLIHEHGVKSSEAPRADQVAAGRRTFGQRRDPVAFFGACFFVRRGKNPRLVRDAPPAGSPHAQRNQKHRRVVRDPPGLDGDAWIGHRGRPPPAGRRPGHHRAALLGCSVPEHHLAGDAGWDDWANLRYPFHTTFGFVDGDTSTRSPQEEIDHATYEETVRANLAVRASPASPLAAPGSTVTLNVEVANRHPEGARLARVALALPRGLTLVGCAATHLGTCDASATPSVTFPMLGGGETAAITVTATVTCDLAEGTRLQPKVQATLWSEDPDMSDNTAPALVEVRGQAVRCPPTGP